MTTWTHWAESLPVTLFVTKTPAATIHYTSLANGRGLVRAYIYLTQLTHFRETWANHLSHSEMQVICDYRQRHLFATLQKQFPNLMARYYPRNRVMHDKTYIFEADGVMLYTTANETTGSWTSAHNHYVEAKSRDLVKAEVTEFNRAWSTSRPVPLPPKD